MIKNLIHSGTFLGYGDRKITVNFYKMGYFLTLKDGVSAIINVPSAGGIYTFSSLFNTNGTITGDETYAVQFANTYVRVKENRNYYEMDHRVTFRLREDDDVRITLIFRVEAKEYELTANPESLTFSGRQEFLPLELISGVDDPKIWTFDGDIWNYILNDTDEPSSTTAEIYGDGWRRTWYIGLDINTGGEQRMGHAQANLEESSLMDNLLVPIVQDSIEYEGAVIAELDIHGEAHGKQVEMDKYGNEGYVEFSYANYDEIQNATVELVDVGYGTNWIHLDSVILEYATAMYFQVDSVRPDAEYTRRWCIIRVHNADRPDDYAECMLIQRNY